MSRSPLQRKHDGAQPQTRDGCSVPGIGSAAGRPVALTEARKYFRILPPDGLADKLVDIPQPKNSQNFSGRRDRAMAGKR